MQTDKYTKSIKKCSKSNASQKAWNLETNKSNKNDDFFNVSKRKDLDDFIKDIFVYEKYFFQNKNKLVGHTYTNFSKPAL